MKAIMLSVLILLATAVQAADNRKPAQSYPGFGSTTPTTAPIGGSPFPGTTDSSGGKTSYVTDEVVAASSATIYNVYCLFGSSSNYSIPVQGNDGRIVRVSAGGSITYEIYKGQKFLGSCPNIHVQTR